MQLLVCECYQIGAVRYHNYSTAWHELYLWVVWSHVAPPSLSVRVHVLAVWDKALAQKVVNGENKLWMIHQDYASSHAAL